MRKTLVLLSSLAYFALRPFIYMIPRDKSLWLFGSWNGRRYADNTKAVFNACLQHKHIRAVWITESKSICDTLEKEGLPCAYKYSIKGLFLSLRAGVYIFDATPKDINNVLSSGAFLVNLWHGIPLKKIERSIDTPGNFIYEGLNRGFFMKLYLYLRAPWFSTRYDLLCVSSRRLVPIFSEAFDVSANRVAITGLPRNDEFKTVSRSLEPSTHNRNIYYMPTFRSSRPSHEWSADEYYVLNQFLSKRNATLTIKLHPLDSSNAMPEGLSNISYADAADDIYLGLRDSFALITDYSSVFFDYLLTNKPIIFYCHDLENYLISDRNLYFDYDSVTPGPKVRSVKELMCELEKILGGTDQYSEERKRRRDEFFEFTDFKSSRRVIESVQSRTS